LTPTYAIRLAGADITDLWKPHVISISVTDRTSDKKADSCTIVLQDSKAELVMPDSGVQLEILLGYEGDDLPDSQRLQSVGKFIVDTISVSGPPNTLVIESKSAAFAENNLNLANIQTKKSRTHEAQTIGSLVSKIAQEHGLTAEVDPKLTAVNLGTVQQTDESDTHLLSRIAVGQGATYKVADNRMLFLIPGNASNGEAEQFAISADSVSSWKVKITKQPEYKSCIATYHDVGECGPVEVTAGSGNPVMRLRNPFKDEEEANAAAKAFVNEARKEGTTVELRMPGRSDLFAGARGVLSGFPYELVSKLELTDIQHTLSRSGYSTEVSGKPL